MEVLAVSHMDDLLSRAIILQPGETIFREEQDEVIPPELIPEGDDTVRPIQVN